MTHIIYLLCILFAVLATAQQEPISATPNTDTTALDDDNANSSAAAPADDSSHSVNIGLPIGTWSILQLNESSRAAVCKQQNDFCASECGGPAMTSLNFCNQTTMAWGCNCRNKVPDCPPYQWPVTLAECQGREQKCESGCTDHPTESLCVEGCTKYFRCNRPGGPQSRLQTNHPDATPIYDAPPNMSSFLKPDFVIQLLCSLLLL
ncbi:hypothetical protein BJV82DRAFT_607596 [Fennellomyces sp. T-0311]|nr:hypothetical protein BJV82DRAFT_607596 [Fennellomyces sp. T-0311]